MNQPVRHHYIPIFYSKQWAGLDGRLCQYSRPNKIVKAIRKHPAATGYMDGLYTVPGLPPELAQYVEREFMRVNDDWAAKALQILLSTDRKSEFGAREKIGWARFLFSLMVRNPENIRRLEQKSDETRSTNFDKNTSIAAMLPDLINSKSVVTEIATMRFVTADLADAKHSLLTSDRPIIMTNGILKRDAYIAIPLSPTRLFLAIKNDQVYNLVMKMTSDQLAYSVNDKVAQQARTYVYGTDESQLRFVANRLGKMVPSTPFEMPSSPHRAKRVDVRPNWKEQPGTPDNWLEE